MSRAAELVRLLQNRRGLFHPVGRKHGIAALVGQLPEAVIRRPVAAARVDDEDRAIIAVDGGGALHNLRVPFLIAAFIPSGKAVAALFPVVGRRTDYGRRADDRPRILKLRDADDLMEIRCAAADFGDKGDVGLAADADDRAAAAKLGVVVVAVGEGHKLRHIDLAGHRMPPAPEQIVAVQALDDIGALPAVDRAALIRLAAGTADKAVPARRVRADIACAEIVDLGRPEVLRPCLTARGLVDDLAHGGGKIAEVCRAVERQRTASGGDVVIAAVMRKEPRVRTVCADHVAEGNAADNRRIRQDCVVHVQKVLRKAGAAGDGGKVCEVAAVQVQRIGAFLINAARIVDACVNRAADSAACDRDGDVGGEYTRVGGRNQRHNAVDDLTAVHRQRHGAAVSALRTAVQPVGNFAAVYRHGDAVGEVVLVGRAAAAHTVPGAAVDGQIAGAAL